MACKVDLLGFAKISLPASRPFNEKLKVKRNLFGAPEPGYVEHQLEVENQRAKEHMLEAYNFQLPRENGTKEDASPSPKPMMPSLIERELKKHQEKLRQQFSTDQDANDPTSIDQTALSGAAECADYSAETTPKGRSCGSACERPKPYTKQKEITETFKVRKSLQLKCVKASAERTLEPVVLPVAAASTTAPESESESESKLESASATSVALSSSQ